MEGQALAGCFFVFLWAWAAVPQMVVVVAVCRHCVIVNCKKGGGAEEEEEEKAAALLRVFVMGLCCLPFQNAQVTSWRGSLLLPLLPLLPV